MKKLAQVVDQVSKELGLSKNQLSLKIGKSRNYLSEIIRNGVSVEKEQEIIGLLLELIDDEVKFLRKQVIDLEAEKAQRHLELVHYENGCENTIDNLEATIAEKDEYINKQDGIINNVRDKNKNLEHQITILKKDLDYKEGVIRKQNYSIKEDKEKIEVTTKYVGIVENENKNLEEKHWIQYDYIQEIKKELSREKRNHNVTRVAGLVSFVALLILLLIK
jgi:chromosome segregation ATPase